MVCYEAKQTKLIKLQQKEKDLISKNCEQKKRWVKKHADLISLSLGQEIESDDSPRLVPK